MPYAGRILCPVEKKEGGKKRRMQSRYVAAQPQTLVNHGDALAKILFEPDGSVGTTGAGANDSDINVDRVLSRSRGQYLGGSVDDYVRTRCWSRPRSFLFKARGD
ncbi:hypothetical protein GE21DRAFT_9965 [Neurospora crassa]|uniref:Uncharacterized protein n=1 Tax=Neurospora crassa (strain ATCC 24698 / 74-OR23-1A / CBS 708.71 / DSM 1257 / FGSC 987) TaxID=367110 RepID=Q7S2A2_NEUCR|nr:hypothetical protein NCU09389 [Neurospora crassa OR74A]EAA29496.2 hypothetical protein NCU09389 [Neurospora crassa OR74A]KHE85692.1 hypothetical protein GE21DRAFT_9965 [Neurospora crassa]|eukprot:XP_958732.2 hypothetical protein NCU09389 [Neurospora crassa OR74A]